MDCLFTPIYEAYVIGFCSSRIPSLYDAEGLYRNHLLCEIVGGKMNEWKKDGKTSSIAIVLLIIGIAIGSIIGYGANAGQVGSLQTQIQKLETQIAGLQADKTQLQGQVSSLQDDKSKLQDQVTSLESDKVGLQAQIATLQNKTQQLEPVILAVRFSPKGGAASQVMYWLGRANKSVHVLIYSFTLNSIGDAVLGAYQRGIDVKIVFEKLRLTNIASIFALQVLAFKSEMIQIQL